MALSVDSGEQSTSPPASPGEGGGDEAGGDEGGGDEGGGGDMSYILSQGSRSPLWCPMSRLGGSGDPYREVLEE